MTAVSASATPAELVEQGTGGGLREVLGRRHLLTMLVRKELRVRYRASVLGLGWSYVKPAVQFAVYFVALGLVLRQNSIPDYAIHLYAGLVVITVFSEAVGNATRSVVVNGDLVRKIFLPRELFPVASVGVAVVHLIPQLVVLGIGCLVAGWRPDVMGLVAMVTSLLLVLVLALGLGLLLAAVTVLFRDAENVVDLVLSVIVWTSPVLYPWQLVADLVGRDSWLLTAYQFNPLTVAVELMHRGTWALTSPGNLEQGPPDLVVRTLVAFGIGLVLLYLGQRVFRRMSGRFAQEL